jgi:preprotein translocase subunit SecG
MKSVAIVAIFLLLVLTLRYLRSRNSQPAQREFKSTDEFVQWLASEG